MDINNVFESKPTIYDKSQKSLRSELNLVDLPPTDVSQQSTTDYIQCYSLLSTKEGFNPLEFRFIFDGYGSLFESLLGLGVRIVKQDGTVCETTDIVSPCNLFFHSLFSNIQLYLNGQLVLDTSNFYPWIAYIQRTLGASTLEKEGVLRDEFYYPNIKPNVYKTAEDAGFKTRYEKTKDSTQFFLLGSLLGNFFNQNRYLPVGTEVKIVLRRNNPYIYLDCATNTLSGFNGAPYRAEITEAIFYAAKKSVSKEVINLHRHQLQANNTFKYVTNEIQMKAISVAKGLSSVASDGIVIGKLPKLMVVGMVETEGFNGNLTNSAFNFQDFNLSELNVTWNGENVENRVIPYNFKGDDDTAGNNFLLALRSLRRTAANEILGNGVNQDTYTNGNVLTAVELLPNSGSALTVNRKGQVKLGLKFKKPLAKPITVLVYLQYQAVFELDRNKQIHFDH